MPIHGTVLYNILRSNFRNFIPDNIFNLVTMVSDSSYLPVEANWLREMAIHDPILAPSKYRRDIFDCDDYVLYLKTKVGLYAANTPVLTKPLAVGYILTQLHAFNFGVDENNGLYILNTQSELREFIFPKTPEQCSHFLGLSSNNSITYIYI